MVTASVVDHGEDQALIFQCEKAMSAFPYSVFASIPQPIVFPLKEADEAFARKAEEYLRGLPDVRYEMHTGQLDDMMSAIENDREPAITGEDGRLTLELITAIYKAGSMGRSVSLPIGKDDPFYTAQGILAAAPHFYEKSASVTDLEGDITLGSDYKK